MHSSITFNLRAVFDNVDHNIVVRDLEDRGITGLEFFWFKTYLIDRKFRVIVNAEHSEQCYKKF